MTHEAVPGDVTVDLTTTELQLILTSLRLLLNSEDDAVEITRLKRLIELLAGARDPRDTERPTMP